MVAILYEGYKLMVPISKLKRDKLSGKRIPPQLFEKSGQTRIRWLIQEMTNSKLFSVSTRSKAKAKAKSEKCEMPDALQENIENHTDGTPTPKRRRTTGKGKAKAAPIEITEDGCMMVTENGKVLKNITKPRTPFWFISEFEQVHSSRNTSSTCQ